MNDDGNYILIHDPQDNWALPFTTLEVANSCWGTALLPPCTNRTPTMVQYFGRLMQAQETLNSDFEVRVIHWFERTNGGVKGNLRHSLLVGPNYTKTSDGVDQSELFEVEWERIQQELQLQKRQVQRHKSKPQRRWWRET